MSTIPIYYEAEREWFLWENNFTFLYLSCAHTHTRLTALCPGLPGWAGTRKIKPIWILLKQETVSGSGIHWAICKYAPRSRQITMPARHRSFFYRPDALPAAQPTVSKHWRLVLCMLLNYCFWVITFICVIGHVFEQILQISADMTNVLTSLQAHCGRGPDVSLFPIVVGRYIASLHLTLKLKINFCR